MRWKVFGPNESDRVSGQERKRRGSDLVAVQCRVAVAEQARSRHCPLPRPLYCPCVAGEHRDPKAPCRPRASKSLGVRTGGAGRGCSLGRRRRLQRAKRRNGKRYYCFCRYPAGDCSNAAGHPNTAQKSTSFAFHRAPKKIPRRALKRLPHRRL